MSKFNVLVIFWCAVMLMQPWMGQGLRIKRSHVQLNATAVASTSGPLMATQAGNGTTSGTAKAMATVASTANPQTVVKSSTRQEPAVDNDKAGAMEDPTITTTHTSAPKIDEPLVGPSTGLVNTLLPVMLMRTWMGQGLRIKRSHVQLNAKAVASTSGPLMATQAGNGTTSGTAKAMATVASTANPQTVVKSSTRQEPAVDNDKAGAMEDPTITTTTHTSAPKIEEPLVGPSTGLLDTLLPELHRLKRRILLMNDALMPRLANPRPKYRHAATVLSLGTGLLPPFAYYKKVVSRGGNLEIKDFELVSPNMVTEDMQQELDSEPEMMDQDLAGVLLLNASKSEPHRGHIMTPSKYYAKYESSPALPLIFDVLQQLMHKMHNSHMKSPLSQFLNGAVELSLQTNREAIDQEEDPLELESDDQLDKPKTGKANKMDKKSKKDNKSKRLDASKKDDLKTKEAAEVAPTRKEDEIVLTCPVHHEHHANRNGEIVDDDVVIVDQCHDA
ncbi:uncharacterized protein LOC108157439 [Drosophila miranda]|uniref:uncharacterized protein LOC108157439 n=1 Tax=Drosophila miranda TaxID=7229 RepID=UPI00143F319A|nr:uncharacterized protein LOC108157439 [Drosophila miranda]